MVKIPRPVPVAMLYKFALDYYLQRDLRITVVPSRDAPYYCRELGYTKLADDMDFVPAKATA